ncbi:MAG: hypothetical protein B6242_01970 [Anaerolineaceae bacterium 4572_78]|nr:MAG: hypothetical protein B6242_01970 [Anaerolineaceae bacterium 4572_78]
MTFDIRHVNYFYANIEDQQGEAYKVLAQMADLGINLLAFAGVPMGPTRTQLTLFPEDSLRLESTAKKIGMVLDGPHHALLVQGDDALGVLANIHEKLHKAKVNVFASTGVTDGKGCYGYILYIRPDDYQRAATALEL